MKPPSFLLIVLACSLALSGCSGDRVEQGTVQVVTTLFPLYDFSRQIGGDRVSVNLLLPPGVEAHVYEPTPRDIVRIVQADVFVYTGEAMEPWAEDLLAGVSRDSLVVADSSQGILLTEDPHFWLDPVQAKVMVDNIARALIQADPKNRDYYEELTNIYKEKLTALDRNIADAMARVQHRTILHSGHFAFGYFAKRYNLNHLSPYAGFEPNSQPTPKNIVELIKKMAALGVKVIYYEELLEPEVARVIVQETGAEMLLLHGVHNVSKQELARGVSYISIMEENLENLKIGLGYE